jgi:hypothetical protein
MPQACISGFTPEPAPAPQALSEVRLAPSQSHWLTSHHWQAGYSLWQHCRSGFFAGDQSLCKGLPEVAQLCQGPEDGLAFLALHRFLLQSMRAAWPGLADEWASWRRWPEATDYPPDLRTSFTPWPGAVVRAAQAVERLRTMPRAQLLARWPSEGAFGQWLQCGSNGPGMAPNSLYGALLGNAGLELGPHPLESRMIWRNLAWIDQAWDAYRKKLGQTPDEPGLQALLIQQCQKHSAFALRAAELDLFTPSKLAPSAPVFVAGEFSPQRTGSWVSVHGEVVAVVREPAGQVLIQLDLRLRGAQPIWFTAKTSLVGITPGDRLRVAGVLQPVARVIPGSHFATRNAIRLLLQAESIQNLN